MRKSGDWNLNLAAAKKYKTGGTLQQTVLMELYLRLRSAYKTDADPRRDAAQKTNGGLTGRRSKRRILGVYVRNYVNPKDPTHSRDTTYNPDGSRKENKEYMKRKFPTQGARCSKHRSARGSVLSPPGFELRLQAFKAPRSPRRIQGRFTSMSTRVHSPKFCTKMKQEPLYIYTW